MKSFILALILLTSTTQACVNSIEENFNLGEAESFDISECNSIEDAARSFGKTLEFRSYRAGYAFEWYGFDVSSFGTVASLLRTDHTDSDGSEEFTKAELSIVRDYFENLSNKKVIIAEFANSYMSGTGISQYALLFSKDEKKMFTVEKYMYAE